jgi:hypothetical protein
VNSDWFDNFFNPQRVLYWITKFHYSSAFRSSAIWLQAAVARKIDREIEVQS